MDAYRTGADAEALRVGAATGGFARGGMKNLAGNQTDIGR